MGAVFAIVLAYLIGSFDFAVPVARARGVDIHTTGSGNPGAANVMRNLGFRAAAPVMLGDMAKGALAAALGTWMGGSDQVAWWAGLAAVVGHCWPVWHRFKGGKGVATAFGVVLWIEPLLGLTMVAVWLVLLATTRISSIGSLTAVAILVPALALMGRPWSVLAPAGILTLVVVARHTENIRSLATGRERKILDQPPP